MYYVLNQDNQIIAADKNLLKLCGFSHIDALNTDMQLKHTLFTIKEQHTLVIKNAETEHTFSIEEIALSSLFDQLTLIVIDTKTYPLDTDTAPLIFSDKADNNQDNILMNHTPKSLSKDKETASLYHILPDISDKHSENKISIDRAKISQTLGVSETDYNTFLNEYISTALELEKDLKSNDAMVQTTAINTLSHLSDLLYLDTIDNFLQTIKTVSEKDCNSAIAIFYDALLRISTIEPDKIAIDTHSVILEDEVKKETTLDLSESILLQTDTLSSGYNIPETKKDLSQFDLKKVEPIHFDFSLSSVADELSLPPSLMEEFMLDFLNQSHSETEKMINAYQKNDLETIQKTSRHLKDIANNLRITPLSNILYNIQSSKNLNHFESLIQEYWGHFLSFEKQIKLLSQEEH